MKTPIMLLPLGTFLAACSTMNSVPIVDDAGHTHFTMNYLNDSRGAYDFPSTRPATGKKVFIFDPKLAAWVLMMPMVI